jgi:hypothetical protein
MTKITLQDNSTEEDDDAGASEHYSGFLPVSDAIASDSDSDYPVSLHRTISDPSSEAKPYANIPWLLMTINWSGGFCRDNLWSHYTSVSTERSGMHGFDHPWTSIPMGPQEQTPLVPKNMFGRTLVSTNS